MAPVKTEVPTVKALRGLGEPKGSVMIVDPGGKCGITYIRNGLIQPAYTVPLDRLPDTLEIAVRDLSAVSFVVCEDFSLGTARRNDPKVPSAIGIGMCRLACAWTDTKFFLAPPSAKSAGHFALSTTDAEAYSRCRNDHERDVVDLAGYVLREMRLPASKAKA